MGRNMAFSTLFLFWGICFILSAIKGVEGNISCYVCTSYDDGCGETIDHSKLLAKSKIQSGCTACGKHFKGIGVAWSHVVRSCTEGSDTCSNVAGYGSCICTTNLCNGQTLPTASVIILLIVWFLVTILQNVLR